MGIIFNSYRKSKREAKHYYHTTVLYGDRQRDIMLTENDVKKGIHRALNNLEDIPKKWYDYILFWR